MVQPPCPYLYSSRFALPLPLSNSFYFCICGPPAAAVRWMPIQAQHEAYRAMRVFDTMDCFKGREDDLRIKKEDNIEGKTTIYQRG